MWKMNFKVMQICKNAFFRQRVVENAMSNNTDFLKKKSALFKEVSILRFIYARLTCYLMLISEKLHFY